MPVMAELALADRPEDRLRKILKCSKQSWQKNPGNRGFRQQETYRNLIKSVCLKPIPTTPSGNYSGRSVARIG